MRAPSEKQINLKISKPTACTLRKIQRPRSAIQSQNVSIVHEEKARPTATLEQKTKDQQDRIRSLIAERKKNKAVVQELQL